MKRKNIKYYVIALVLIITIIALSIPYIIAEYRLNTEIEKLREEGIPVTIQEFKNKYYRSVPKSQNAAATFKKAFSMFPYTLHKCGYHKSKKKLFTVFVDDRIYHKLSPEEFKKVEKYVEESAVFFREMEKIQKYKFIRFAYKWEDVNDMEMPELNQFRAIIKLYTIKAEFAINLNDPQQASKLFEEMFNITNLESQFPSDFGQFVFYACDSIVLRKLERAMSMLQFSSEQLKSFNNIFDEHEKLIVKGWPIVWQWDLVNLLTETGFFKNYPSSSSYFKDIKIKYKYLLLYCSGGLATIFQDDLKVLRKIINIPIETYTKQKNNLERIRQKIYWAGGSSSVIVNDLYARVLKAIARLRCAKTACAIERFRLKYSKFPEKLKQLVPEFLKKIPIDPFDGKNIRYFRSNFAIEYEVQIKPKKKLAPKEVIPAEIADIFGNEEIPERPKYKFLKVKKTGFQVYSVGQNLKDEKSSLIVEEHDSGTMFGSNGKGDDITFTVLDK